MKFYENMKFTTVLGMMVVASVMVQSKSLETFIVNGTNTTETVGFYAYLEIFRQSDFGGPTMYFGGGTLISTSFILTVAQNVAGFKSWRVGLGANRISNMQWFLSTTAFIFDEYNDQTLLHNIALLRLTQHTKTGTGITPIALPAASGFLPTPTTILTLYGFGFGTTNHQPDILQSATFHVVTQVVCGDKYPHLSKSGHILFHFCAEHTTIEGNICAGDQGGPAISESGLIGIQSFYRHENCWNSEAQPAAFISVPRYVNWFNNITSTQPLL